MQVSQLAARWSAAQSVAEAAFLRVQTAEWQGQDAGDLERQFDCHAARADAIADTIAIAQPATIEEAALKFRILLQRYGDGHGGLDQAEPIFAFLDDLESLAQR